MILNTGFVSPRAASVDTGSGNLAWSNINNILASDNSYATATYSPPGTGSDTTNFLHATDFGFNIPSDAAISGVEVSIECKYTLGAGIDGSSGDEVVQLILAGSRTGDNGAVYIWNKDTDASQGYNPSAPSIYRWSLPLKPSDINASDFGVALQVRAVLNNAGSSPVTMLVDSIKIKVYYIVPDNKIPSRQHFFGGIADQPTAASTEYASIFGGNSSNTWAATESWRRSQFPIAGVLQDFRVKIDTAPGGSDSVIFTVMKNGVATSMAVTITGANTEGEFIGDLDIAATDTISIRHTVSGSPSLHTVSSWSLQFTATALKRFVIIGGTGSGLANAGGAVQYQPASGGFSWSSTLTLRRTVIAVPGTIRSYAFSMSGVQDSGVSIAIVLYKNGNAVFNSTLTFTNTSPTSQQLAGLAEDILPGDLLSIRATITGTITNARFGNWGIEIEPSIQGESQIAGYGNLTSLGASTAYFFGSNHSGITGSTTEADRTTLAVAKKKFYVTRLQVFSSGNMGATGRSRTYSVRKNGSNGQNSFTIRDAGSVGFTCGVDEFDVGDTISIASAPSGSPTNTDFFWALAIRNSHIINTAQTLPGTVANNTGVGTVAWTNPSNAGTSDDTYATQTHSQPAKTSNYLKATNYGFSIPAHCNVLGFMASVEAKQTLNSGTGTAADTRARIVDASGTIGSFNPISTSFFTTTLNFTDTLKNFGGHNNLWGLSWTPANVNDSDFGFAWAAISSGTTFNLTLSADHMSMMVFYENPKIETVSDNFNDNSLNTNIWGSFGTGVAETNKRIEIQSQLTSTYSGIDTGSKVYDLTDSYVHVQYKGHDVGAVAITSFEAYPINLSNAAGTDWLQWQVLPNANLVQAFWGLSSSTNLVFSDTYDPDIYRWFRIRESNDETIWESSANGFDWTVRHTMQTPISITHLRVGLLQGTWQAEATQAKAYFDNVSVGVTGRIEVFNGVSITNIAAINGIPINSIKSLNGS